LVVPLFDSPLGKRGEEVVCGGKGRYFFFLAIAPLLPEEGLGEVAFSIDNCQLTIVN
jgi:hypothetical protein